MKDFWKGDEDGLERVLRNGRPEARDELLADLVRTATPRASARRWSRVAFASSLTVFMVGFFASFGGLGYAAANAHSIAKSMTRIVTPAKTQHTLAVKTKSAARDEYDQQTYTPPVAKPKPPKVIEVAGTSTKTPQQASGELPFTGLGLGITATLGLTLVGLGAMLRRRESRAE